MRISPLAFDHREHATAEALGPLPEWDLSDLYPAPDAPEITRDLDWLRGECAAFAADYEGKMTGLGASGMLEAVQRYERIENVSGRIMSYAGLRHYQNSIDPARAKFFGDMQSAMTDITAPLVFVPLEINRIEESALEGWLDEAPLPAHPRGQAVPTLRRTREVPARPVRGGCCGMESSLR
jgi:oligoendopeptidase F